MRILLILSIFISFYLISACTSQSINLKEYVPPSEKQLNNDYFIKMKVHNSVQLEVEDIKQLNNISSCEISPDGKSILITDNFSSTITLYDIRNGKKEEFFKSNRFLSDSLVKLNIPPLKYKKYEDCEVEYETIDEGVKFYESQGVYNINSYLMVIKNEISRSVFYKNKIFSIASINSGFHTTNKSLELHDIGSRACVLSFDNKLNYNKLIPTLCKYNTSIDILETEKIFTTHNTMTRTHYLNSQNKIVYYYGTKQVKRHTSTMNKYYRKRRNNAFGFPFAVNNNYIYLFANNQFNKFTHLNSNYDSLVTVMKYDMEKGEISPADYIPKEYSNSKQGYDLEHLPMFATIQENIYVAYPYGTKIKNLTDSSEFELQNLPITNQFGFDYLTHRTRHFNFISKQYLSHSNIVTLLPIKIWKIFKINNNIGVWLSIIKEISPGKFGDILVLQEYTTDGRLLSYSTIDKNTDNGEFRNIAYDNSNKQMIIFRYKPIKTYIINTDLLMKQDESNKKYKIKKNWIMEKINWE